MDKRAASTVVSKGLEIAIVLLYVGIMSAALYGSVVPEARETADDAVAERALAAAVEDIRAAVPSGGDGTVRLTVDLPATIGGEPYTVVPQGRTLVLQHPHDAVDSRVALLLPDRVEAITGHWKSGEETVVEIEASDDGVDLRLVSG